VIGERADNLNDGVIDKIETPTTVSPITSIPSSSISSYPSSSIAFKFVLVRLYTIIRIRYVLWMPPSTGSVDNNNLNNGVIDTIEKQKAL